MEIFSLADCTRAEFAAVYRGGNDGGKTALENAARLPNFQRTACAGSDHTNVPVSSLLIGTVNRARTEPRRPKSPIAFGSVLLGGPTDQIVLRRDKRDRAPHFSLGSQLVQNGFEGSSRANAWFP